MSSTIPPALHSTLLPFIPYTIHQLISYEFPTLAHPITSDSICFSSTLPANASTTHEIALWTPIPSPEVVHELRNSLSTSIKNGSKSVEINAEVAVDLWILSYWAEIHRGISAQATWKKLIMSLESVEDNTLAVNVEHELGKLPWDGTVKSLVGMEPIGLLSLFATTQWLTDTHIDIILQALSHILQETISIHPHNTIFRYTQFFEKLKYAYMARHLENYETSQKFRYLRSTAELLLCHQTCLPLIINNNGFHWIAAMVDTRVDEIRFGDSLQASAKIQGHFAHEVYEIIEWWLSQHTTSRFKRKALDITQQHDSYSCGILAVNALAHNLLPDLIPLSRPEDMRSERLQVLLDIIKRCPTEVSQLLDTSSPESHLLSPEVEIVDDFCSEIDEIVKIDYGVNNQSLAAKRLRDEESVNVPAKERKKVQSAISIACEQASQDQKKALQKSSILFYCERLTTNEADIRRQEIFAKIPGCVEGETQSAIKSEKIRVGNRERQRRRRQKIKDEEIANGERLPDGRKVEIQRLVNVETSYTPPRNEYERAELSRPNREEKERAQARKHKPQGRKRTQGKKYAKRMNWHGVFWDFIDRAIHHPSVGPRWSTRKLVDVLKQRDRITFKKLRASTIEGWIDRSGPRPCWSERALAMAQAGNHQGHSHGGRKEILQNYPHIEQAAANRLQALRNSKLPITLVTARAVIIAIANKHAPEIFKTKVNDGSFFKCSESFVRKWLRDVLNWSIRRATQTAQKLPDDWEVKCEQTAIRMAYLIKEYDILPQFIVNSDQTQVSYAQGSNLSWTHRGAKDVSIVGQDEKRAFTALVSVRCDGGALPLQAIYKGASQRSLPVRSRVDHTFDKAMSLGITLEPSRTDTYWATEDTMLKYAAILQEIFNREKAKAGRPPSQRCIWLIDCWSVHRSRSFLGKMKLRHPTIIVLFVPGGCTSKFQPCDVGIQRPFKHAIMCAYHKDVVDEVTGVLDEIEGTKDEAEFSTKLNLRLKLLRDRSMGWLVEGFKVIQNKDLVKAAFRHCAAGGFNLSYESLTSYEIRERVRKLRTTAPHFYEELTAEQHVPDASVPFEPHVSNWDVSDDTSVPTSAVVESMIKGVEPEGFRKRSGEQGLEPCGESSVDV